MKIPKLPLITLAAALSILPYSGALAVDSSAPPILQMFEASYKTIEKRAPDIFMAGYGAMWTPPPGRADQGNFSVGYDVYDRFDLGSANNYTLYGSEKGLKTTVQAAHRASVAVYTDMIWNHNGFSNLGTPGFNAAGSYPGFSIQLQTTNPNNPGYNTRGYNDVDGDFHGAFESGDINGRVAGLIDIAQEKNWQFVRHPVPGFVNNIPAGTTPAFGRLANVPSETNRRFYPDRDLPSMTVFDPATNETVTIYPYNTANPMAGDPVEDNATGLLMRNAQWMVQEIGVDGFRMDAVKHMPTWAMNYFDRSVYRAITKPALDGSQQYVFSFGEVFDGNRSFVQQFIKKNLNTGTIGQVRGNRDALDFPLYFAMNNNLTNNGTTNDWRNVVNFSQDFQDDNLANNGSQGVGFVQSHDSFGPYLSNVAHAYALMRPGNQVVYFNAKEFGTNRDFPKDGRGDALGGFYGDVLTTLVNIRNTHGRGNYQERWLTKEALIYERQNSMIVALSNRLDNGSDLFTGVQTFFPSGTRLIELSGNSSNATIDPNNVLPEVLIVDANGKVDIRIPRNKNVNGVEHDKGYLIYGLPTPVGTMNLTNVAQTLAAETPTAATNGTARLTALPVITADAFAVQLQTIPVMIDGWHDVDADGDQAVLRLNEGIDLNGTGTVDFRTPGNISYGFEDFVTKRSPLFSGGDGEYIQNIDATQLPEGQNFITVRAYRHSSTPGTPLYTDFRKAVYVDRLKPESAPNDFAGVGSATATTRDLTMRSLDLTADKINVFIDLPAALTDAQVINLLSQSNSSGQIDRDLFTFRYFNVGDGNHVITIVTREITGNTNVQRFVGQYTDTTRGAGLGDLNYDGQFAANDVTGTSFGMEAMIYPNGAQQNNTQFIASADMNADGLMDSRDLYLQRDRFVMIGAPQEAIDAARLAVLKRADLNGNHASAADADDIDFLFANFGNTAWKFDFDVDGWPTPSGADQQDVDVMIRTVFQTEYGDANLDGQINLTDFNILAGNFGIGSGWGQADFNGDGTVNLTDFNMLAGNFGFMTGDPLPPLEMLVAQAASNGIYVPEPAAASLLLFLFAAARRRRA